MNEAAGLWTTPTDLAKAAIAIQQSLKNEENALLNKSTAVDMLTTQTPNVPNALEVFVEKVATRLFSRRLKLWLQVCGNLKIQRATALL